jgi:hypothetical protein
MVANAKQFAYAGWRLPKGANHRDWKTFALEDPARRGAHEFRRDKAGGAASR